MFLLSNSLLRFSADKPAKPNTIASPIYESSLEYSIRITDRVLPKIEGNIDNTKSQLPQHPKGTREKKEKKELRAVLPEPVPRIPFFFLSKLQPNPLVYIEIKTCAPIPADNPKITIEFILKTALIAAVAGRLGVVITTTAR